jgi:hypothetical protein
MQRGFGILFHKSPYYIQPGYGQSGEGIGSIFRSLFRFLAPAAKKTFKAVGHIGKQIMSNSGVKDVLKTVKDEAIRTGVNAVANVIAGNPVIEQSDIADSRDRIATTVRKIQPGEGKKRKSSTLAKSGKKKRKLSEPDLFSE